MTIRFECFGMTILKARAVDCYIEGIEQSRRSGALRLQLPNDGSITLFMPYDTALEYASAINACNDREAVSNDLSSRT